MISLWQMTVICEIMKTGSISAAARQLGRTQPALSATVKELERAMNCRLFQRQKNRLIPVPEAFFLLDRATEILDQVDDLKQLLKSGGEVTPTKINVSSMPVFGDHFLPGIIAEFSKKHPKANFQVAVQGSPEVISSMETQRFDVGLAERSKENDLIHCRRFDVDCVCALPKGDPLLAKSVIEPADLASRPCASFLPDHHIAKALRAAFDKAGVDFDPKFQMQNGAAQYEIIGAGAGFGVFSPLNAWIHHRLWSKNNDIAFRRFAPKITYQFSIITPKRRPLSRTAMAFERALEAAVIKMLDEAQSHINDTPTRQA
ncbi:LysR family transcriptional regulator [Alphaproteobacteria bacterium]|nr:LysR family transcriptional regulator [Alphaproteobacteria bacterium]